MVSLYAALAVMALSADPGQTVLLDFYSDSCGPCRAMDATVHDLEASGYPVRRVNIVREPELAAQFHVQRIPCYVMLRDGREVDRVVGGTSFSRLQRMFKLAAAPAPSAGRAPALLAQGRPMIPVPPLQGRVPGPAAGPPASDAALIAASVRLRVEDPDGRSCGTGTIIDARQGEALILTCGHLFRDSQGNGRIEVDLFGPGSPRRVAGKLVSYDLSKDVGLVKIAVPGQVVVARVAPPSRHVGKGEMVITVGCNNGDDPTAAHSRVLFVDKFLGPPNLQIGGEPVEGRSGGGVFSSDGMLVGICNAADHIDHAGCCAALPTIYAEMDRAGVSFAYKEEPKLAIAPVLLASADAPAALGQLPPQALPMGGVGLSPGGTGLSPVPAEAGAEAPAMTEPARPPKLPAGEQAALDEIQRRLKEGAEVICVIRNGRDPKAKSEVLMLNHASPALIDRLTNTSLEVPRERTPILEWDATDGYRHNHPLPGSGPTR
jgi:thiol-disulfide isomerase/thioredoxin